MENVLEALKTRRSIRAYSDKPVAGELVDQILEAGLYAASGNGRQSAEFVLVTDAALIKRLSQMNAAVMGASGDPFYGAPVAIVVFADSDVATFVQDGSLAMGNLMLAAHALGLGSVWINRAKQMFQSDEGKMLMSQWGLSQSMEGVGICVVGHAAGALPVAAPRRKGRIHRAD